MALIIGCMKQREFQWSSAAVRALDGIRHKIKKKALVLSLPDFEKVFEVGW